MKTWCMSLWLPEPLVAGIPPPPFSCLPQAARQLPAVQGLCGAITCGSEQVFLLAYIKHLAASSRQTLKAGMCSPRGEVTIQESCFLKGFCKTLGLPGGYGGQRNGIYKWGWGRRNEHLNFWLVEAVLSAEGSLHLPPLRKEAKMSSVSTSPFCICLETGNHLKAVRNGELAKSGWKEKWG